MMRKYIVFLIIISLLIIISCEQKELLEPNSILIVGTWEMNKALVYGQPLDRNYASYRLEFVRGGAYNLTNEFNDTSFGRWVMIDNGATLIFNPATAQADTINILKLQNDSLQFVYKGFAEFNLIRRR